MNPANHIHEEDLALFALQILPEDEVQAVLSHLEHCESCRTQVGMMQGDLVSYAMTAEMHKPPAAMRERLLRRIGHVRPRRRRLEARRDVHAAAGGTRTSVGAHRQREEVCCSTGLE